jgi:putative membrane protein
MGMTAIFAAFWVWTLSDAVTLTTGRLENVPVLLLLGFLLGTYPRFRFSDLSYGMILAFLMLHIYGAQYLYPHNPFGEWLRVQFSFSRNPYDRLVHFAFGLLMAYPLREVSLKGLKLSSALSWWMPILVVLALSAVYEMLEWLLVLFLSPEQGSAFLGMQGDPWDAQKDMALAFVGSLVLVVLKLIARGLCTKGANFSSLPLTHQESICRHKWEQQ